VFEREEKPGVFDLKDATVCNGSTITGGGSPCITTPRQQWAYAAVFPLREDPKSPLKGEAIIIRVEASIWVGSIGVAVAQPDLREFICKEEIATPAGRRSNSRCVRPSRGLG